MGDEKNENPNKSLERFEDADLDFGLLLYSLHPPETGYGHLDVFIEAVNDGIYPPVETIFWLKECFEKFKKTEGDRDLKDLLGLNSGPGRSTVFVESKRKRIAEEIARDVAALVRLGLSINKACKAIGEKCAAGIEYGFDEHSAPGHRSIRNYYYKERNALSHHDLASPIAEKEKPYIFEFLIKSEKSQIIISAPSADPDGGDLIARLSALKKKVVGEVLGPFRFGQSVLNSLPEDTRSWVECEFK